MIRRYILKNGLKCEKELYIAGIIRYNQNINYDLSRFFSLIIGSVTNERSF